VEADGHGGVAIADEGVEPLVGLPEQFLGVDDDGAQVGDGGGTRGAEDGFDGGFVGADDRGGQERKRAPSRGLAVSARLADSAGKGAIEGAAQEQDGGDHPGEVGRHPERELVELAGLGRGFGTVGRHTKTHYERGRETVSA